MTVFPCAIFTDIKINSGLKEIGITASNCKTVPQGMTTPKVAVEMIVEGIEHNKSRICVGKDSKTMKMNMFYRLNLAFACKLIHANLFMIR